MRFFAILTTVVFALSMPWHALAEEASPGESSAEETQPPAATAEEASASETSGEEAQQPPLLDKGQLDQLLSPIALYPDTLLSQVLIASTYPLEVVQAERWVTKNKELKGDALEAAVAKEDWDDSIKGLTVVPDVLAMMNEDLDWTAKLGDAVLAQQADVMEAVQRLRALAQSNDMLKSNEQQTVTVTDEPPAQPATVEPAEPHTTTVAEQPPPQQVIVIEQTSPEIVYVPYYNPAVVYGTWPYAAYPPYYFPPRPGYIYGGAIARGLAWGAGFAIGNAIWGNGFNWRNNDIHVNRNVNVNVNNRNVNANWQHNSYHRRGVSYNNKNVQNKFAKGGAGDKRPDFRGHGDKRPGGGLGGQKPDLGGKRPGAGDKRPGGGVVDKRPGGGDKRPGGGLGDKKPDLGGKKRPNVGDMESALKKKPAGAQKPKAGNAFDPRDGAKAKDFSKRGKASVGDRSAPKAKKPKAQKPKPKSKPAVHKPKSRPKPSAQRPKSRPKAQKPRSAPKRPSVNRSRGGGGGGGRGRGGGGGGGRRR